MSTTETQVAIPRPEPRSSSRYIEILKARESWLRHAALVQIEHGRYREARITAADADDVNRRIAREEARHA